MQVLFLGPCSMQEAPTRCSGTCHVQDCNFKTLSHQISCLFQDVPRGYLNSWLLLLGLAGSCFSFETRIDNCISCC